MYKSRNVRYQKRTKKYKQKRKYVLTLLATTTSYKTCCRTRARFLVARENRCTPATMHSFYCGKLLTLHTQDISTRDYTAKAKETKIAQHYSYTTQQNTTQHNQTKPNPSQPSTTQHNTTQYSAKKTRSMTIQIDT